LHSKLCHPAYQGPISQCNDPVNTGDTKPLRGVTAATKDKSFVFRETIYDRYMSTTSTYITEFQAMTIISAHEIGHQFGMKVKTIIYGTMYIYENLGSKTFDELGFSGFGLQKIAKTSRPGEPSDE
jgi:hypothetical protein